MFKYDSTHGGFKGKIRVVDESTLETNGKQIHVVNKRYVSGPLLISLKIERASPLWSMDTNLLIPVSYWCPTGTQCWHGKILPGDVTPIKICHTAHLTDQNMQCDIRFIKIKISKFKFKNKKYLKLNILKILLILTACWLVVSGVDRTLIGVSFEF